MRREKTKTSHSKGDGPFLRGRLIMTSTVRDTAFTKCSTTGGLPVYLQISASSASSSHLEGRSSQPSVFDSNVSVPAQGVHMT